MEETRGNTRTLTHTLTYREREREREREETEKERKKEKRDRGEEMQKQTGGWASAPKQIFLYLFLAIVVRSGQQLFNHVKRVSDLHDQWNSYKDQLPFTKFTITQEKVGYGQEVTYASKIVMNYTVKIASQGQVCETMDMITPITKNQDYNPLQPNWEIHAPGFLIALLGHEDHDIAPMRVGGHRVVNIPGSHGYGLHNKAINIGPYFDLVVDIEVISVVRELCDDDEYATVCHDKRSAAVEPDLDYIKADRLTMG